MELVLRPLPGFTIHGKNSGRDDTPKTREIMIAFVRYTVLVLLLISAGFTQVTGLLENFNDNVLTGWEVPADQTAGTFALTEADSILRIDYNRNSQSYEWDNFNFTPPAIISANNTPKISVRVKSGINTMLTFKPIYQSGSNDWLQVSLPADDSWHNYKFDLVAAKPYEINRIYMYLDGGSTAVKTGVVYFDDLRLGDSVRTVDEIDLAKLERLIDEANRLHDNAIEGSGEGEFESGSKTVLKDWIADAEAFILRTDISTAMIDSALWELADACVTFESSVHATDIGLIDPLATKETKYLFINLDDLAGKYLLFGMHDATGYGVGWSGDDDRSDVKDVCGSYPAVYSEDMNKVDRDDEVDRMRYRLISAYDRGGVITTCWHQYDPEGRSFYSEYTNGENIVATILPGGEYHQFYKDRLRNMALFFKTLRGVGGESVPVIFRPYHEHTGPWFWWGAGECSTEEYNQIWQFTVEYLRDSLNVHNLIYALSPASYQIVSKDSYYNIYPGDDYIDIFGFDNYFTLNITGAELEQFKSDLRSVAGAAREKGKIAALTEVGQENIVTSNLFTQYILNPVKTDSLTSDFAYAAVWRNQDTGHHFAPYPGHASVPDFIQFYNDSYTIFQNNLPDMYSLPAPDVTPPQLTGLSADEFYAFQTAVTIQVKSDERAFLRYAFSDQSFDDMPHEFSTGQGGYEHSTVIEGSQGDSFHLFIRAADYNGNAMSASAEVKFKIDTLQRPVSWNEKYYSTSGWLTGNGPFHFDNGSTSGTVVPYSRTVYLRKTFDVVNPDSLFQMLAFIQYDNGFILYVNGHEIRRVNMSADVADYYTWAGSSTQTSINVTLDSSALAYMNNGQNVIAAEVHQYASDSSDFKFDLKLIDPDVVIAYASEWAVYAQGQAPPIKTIGASAITRPDPGIPLRLELQQNYPNPFNPSTTIRFGLEQAGPVQLSVYDLNGRRVAELVNGRMAAGWHSVSFSGKTMASGVYYYHLLTVQGARVRKMVLIK
jgi:mannan endo-1,4-beta-mannosidase